MNRYFLRIFTGLLAFAAGSAIALNVYRNSKAAPPEESAKQTSDRSFTAMNFREHLRTIPVQLAQSSKIPTEPFCKDEEISPIWNRLIKDKTFQDWQADSRDSLDCAEMIEIKEIALSRDGRKNFFLRGKNLNLCSPVGNCAFWIYEKRGSKYEKLLYWTDLGGIDDLGKQVRTNKTRGYFDVVLKGHLTASDTSYDFFKFDGKKYIRNKCLVETPIKYTNGQPQWRFVACREFYRNWEKRN